MEYESILSKYPTTHCDSCNNHICISCKVRLECKSAETHRNKTNKTKKQKEVQDKTVHHIIKFITDLKLRNKL